MTRLSRSLRTHKKFTRRLGIETLESRVVPSTSPLLPFLASAGSAHQLPQPDVNDNVVFGNPAGGTGSTGGPTFSSSSVPQLSSLPGAKASLYLNFTGDFTASWGSFSNITTPAYDIDGDPTTFTQTELNNITQIWQYVAEDYAPFNINVTTVPPTNMGHGFTQKIDIGGGGAWLGSLAGGVSYIGSFVSNSVPNISFVFPDNLGTGFPKYVGDASSHEAGHAFGLYHQSQYDANGNKIAEYYTGPGDGTAPIMGDSYASALSRWWLGPDSNSATQIQDDMAVIANATNGFGYRDDSTGNTMGTAHTLTVNSGQISGSGIIIKTTDTNFWSFTTGAGSITLNMNVAAGVNNLVGKIVLEDANGNIIATGDDNSGTAYGGTITANVAAGTYYLVAESHGGYGDVGQYTLSGSINSTTVTIPGVPTGLTATAGDSQVSLAWSASSGATSYNIYRSLTPGGEGATAYKTGVTATSYTDTGLTDGTKYYYTVSAVNSAGESGQSSEMSATPQAAVPSIPGGLSATAGNAQVSLTWNASTGATSYNVYRSLTAGGEGASPYKTGVTTTSFTDTGLTNGTTYYYQVTAVNATGESGKSSEMSATPHVAATSLAIDSGGKADGNFVADTDFTGGHKFSTRHSIDTSAVTNPAPQSVYQTERYGNFTYTIPNLTPGASYTVRLHFSENYWGSAGRRLFNVSINGTQVLTNFDIFATAGASFKAIVEAFTATADANGNITIVFTTVRNNAKVNGIEILSQSGASASGTNLIGSRGPSAEFLGHLAHYLTASNAANDGTTAGVASHDTHGTSPLGAGAVVTQKSLEQSLGDPFAWSPRHANAGPADWTGDMLVQWAL